MSALNNSAPTGWFFDKSVVEIKVVSKSDKNNRYFTWGPLDIFYYISLNFSWNEMFQKKVLEKIKTHTSCSKCFFNRAKYGMWQNIVVPGRPQMTMLDTLRICNTYCFSVATMVAQTLLNITLHINLLTCGLLTNAVSGVRTDDMTSLIWWSVGKTPRNAMCDPINYIKINNHLPS